MTTSSVAVTVRTIEYLKRKKSSISTTYDRTLSETRGMEPWRAHLESLRAGRVIYDHVDLACAREICDGARSHFP